VAVTLPNLRTWAHCCVFCLIKLPGIWADLSRFFRVGHPIMAGFGRQSARITNNLSNIARIAAGFDSQSQLAALAKEGAAKYHFVDYAPPTFMVFRDQIALQMTLRNSLQFGPAKGSIYKRAAQSFDLFLAPQMKDLSDRISPDVEFQFLDFSVLNKLSPGGPKGTSEAIEFICPRAAVKQFVSAEITNQQLLDQSIILVNGVRIALNLQLVE
jgi:hypothetical protein